MFRPQLDLTPLEGRLAPASGTSCPPEDPMDNPPPVLPGGTTGGTTDTKADDKTGKNKAGKTAIGFTAALPPIAPITATATTTLLPMTAALIGKSA